MKTIEQLRAAYERARSLRERASEASARVRDRDPKLVNEWDRASEREDAAWDAYYGALGGATS